MLQSIIDALTAHERNIGPHDVAAGVHESILNAYSVAHHRNEHPKPNNPYKGGVTCRICVLNMPSILQSPLL